MHTIPSDIAFTSAVKSIQSKHGSRVGYAKMEQGRGWQTSVTPELTSFLADLDMFYLGSANASGQPYIQYRGGPRGFLKPIDEQTLAFADFGGNRQFITLGNLSENPRAFIFLMDYAHRRRVKLWVQATVVEDDPALMQKLQDPSYPAIPDRAILFTIEAWDINCPQHIHQRFSEMHFSPVVRQLRERVRELEAQLTIYEKSGMNTQ